GRRRSGTPAVRRREIRIPRLAQAVEVVRGCRRAQEIQQAIARYLQGGLCLAGAHARMARRALAVADDRDGAGLEAERQRADLRAAASGVADRPARQYRLQE